MDKGRASPRPRRLAGDTASEAIAINNRGDVVGYSKGPTGLQAFLWTAATGMQNVGTLPGGNASRALAINDAGCVVGSATTSSGDHAFIWTKQEGMTDLNSAASAGLGVVFAEAHAINNAGQILILGKSMPEADSVEGNSFPPRLRCGSGDRLSTYTCPGSVATSDKLESDSH